MSNDRDMTDADWRLLDRYLAGECNGQELEEARRRWGHSAPEALRAVLESSPHIGEERTARAWSEVQRQMRLPPARPEVPWWQTPASWRIAAAVLVLLLGAGTLARLLSPRAESSPQMAIRDESTGIGERRTVGLPDGSRVTLAPVSRIRYRPNFGGGSRDVELVGQAFFSVTHDASRPFTVRAGVGVARVLGTEFSVRTTDNADRTEVVVASGRVRLHDSSDSVGPILTAGTRGLLRAGGGIVEVTAIDPREALAWRDGQLHFAAAPLSDVVRELGRWFRDPIVIGDSSLGTRPITADFHVEGAGALERTLDALAIALDSKWERRADTVVLRSR